MISNFPPRGLLAENSFTSKKKSKAFPRKRKKLMFAREIKKKIVVYTESCRGLGKRSMKKKPDVIACAERNRACASFRTSLVICPFALALFPTLTGCVRTKRKSGVLKFWILPIEKCSMRTLSLAILILC